MPLTASFVEDAVVVQELAVLVVENGTIGVHQGGMDQLLVVALLVQVKYDELTDDAVVSVVDDIADDTIMASEDVVDERIVVVVASVVEAVPEAGPDVGTSRRRSS